MININNFFNIIKIVSLCVSIIIGAGFASGREILSFFTTANSLSDGGYITVLVVSSLIFFTVIYATLELTRKNQTNTYTNFLNSIFKNKTLVAFFEICIIMFMFISLSSMFAGFTAITTQAFDFDKNLSRLLFVILNFVFLLKGHTYLVKLSTLILPIFIIGAFYFGYLYYDSITLTATLNNLPKHALNGLTYSSYNLITTIAILSTMNDFAKSKFTNFVSSFLVSLILTSLVVVILIPLLANYELVKNSDMPIFLILSSNNKNLVYYYFITMVLATLSTSIANAYGTINYFSTRFKLNYLLTSLLIITSSVLFSLIGFSNIVNFVYPIFGFFGIIKILKILQTYFKRK